LFGGFSGLPIVLACGEHANAKRRGAEDVAPYGQGFFGGFVPQKRIARPIAIFFNLCYTVKKRKKKDGL
jgi:hypothetical protein